MIHADTHTVQLADGARTLNFAVIGDPCEHAVKLRDPFTDPFSGTQTTLGATAPEVICAVGEDSHDRDTVLAIIRARGGALQHLRLGQCVDLLGFTKKLDLEKFLRFELTVQPRRPTGRLMTDKQQPVRVRS